MATIVQLLTAFSGGSPQVYVVFDDSTLDIREIRTRGGGKNVQLTFGGRTRNGLPNEDIDFRSMGLKMTPDDTPNSFTMPAGYKAGYSP